MTLTIRSGSPKPNQLFKMSQCYIHVNLGKIWQSVHEISCKQESVTPTLTPTLMPTPTGCTPKTICPPPLSVGGHKNTLMILSSDRQVWFYFDLGFTASQDYFTILSRVNRKVGLKREIPEKKHLTTRKQNMWPNRGSNTLRWGDERFRSLKISGLNHSATGMDRSEQTM